MHLKSVLGRHLYQKRAFDDDSKSTKANHGARHHRTKTDSRTIAMDHQAQNSKGLAKLKDNQKAFLAAIGGEREKTKTNLHASARNTAKEGSTYKEKKRRGLEVMRGRKRVSLVIDKLSGGADGVGFGTGARRGKSRHFNAAEYMAGSDVSSTASLEDEDLYREVGQPSPSASSSPLF